MTEADIPLRAEWTVKQVRAHEIRCGDEAFCDEGWGTVAHDPIGTDDGFVYWSYFRGTERYLQLQAAKDLVQIQVLDPGRGSLPVNEEPE